MEDPRDYDIFTSKISGELYVIAKLNIPSYFDINYELDSIKRKLIPLRFPITLMKDLVVKKYSVLLITKTMRV